MTFRRTTIFPTHFSQVVIAAIILAGSAACGGSGGSGGNAITDPGGSGSNNGGNSSGTSHSLAVTVMNNAYSPGTTAVAKGSTVQWTWNSCQGDGYGGSVCTAHNVTFDDGVTSETQESGTFSRTFDKAGTYKYHCTVHGAAMSGQVTIE
jgi:plastocyanin